MFLLLVSHSPDQDLFAPHARRMCTWAVQNYTYSRRGTNKTNWECEAARFSLLIDCNYCKQVVVVEGTTVFLSTCPTCILAAAAASVLVWLQSYVIVCFAPWVVLNAYLFQQLKITFAIHEHIVNARLGDEKPLFCSTCLPFVPPTNSLARMHCWMDDVPIMEYILF